ncbi:MAG: hypothetical protein AAFV32_07645 [Myxococcota bacterium]
MLKAPLNSVARIAALLLFPSVALAQTREAPITDEVEVQPEQPPASPVSESADDLSWTDAGNGAGDSEQAALGVGDTPSQRFRIKASETSTAYIKPILWISSSAVHFSPDLETNENQADRVSTLILTRFGFQGALIDTPELKVTFKSEFERNVGFVSGSRGPVGTGVWEGIAALQARENYIRLQAPIIDDLWSIDFAGGIVADPASIDFVPISTLDLFGMDPYVRDPLLLSGFDQAQGFLLRSSLDLDDMGKFTVGQHFTAGNPLTTTLSFSFGGNVSTFGTLFLSPFADFSNSNIPGSNIHLMTYSPSLTYESKYFDVRSAAQFYWVDLDFDSDTDTSLRGHNLRATAQVKLLDSSVRVFGGISDRRNQQSAVPDITIRAEDDFEATIWNAGLEVDAGELFRRANIADMNSLLIGGGYYQFDSDTGANTADSEFINIAATYWILPDTLATGIRYGRVSNDTSASAALADTESFFLSLRMFI